MFKHNGGEGLNWLELHFLKKELNRKTIHKETNYLDSKSNGGRNEFSLSSF